MIETVERLKSAHLQNERTIWVREPTDPSTAGSLTVFLDGEFYRDRVGAVAVINQLRSQGCIADSWFVFVSMESVEARWRECPCHPPFARFVTEELLPWLGRRHPKIKAVRQRVLAGLSYTGLAAAFIAKEYPGVFQKIVSQSGSFWSNDCWLVHQFESPGRPIPTGFYLDVGTSETQENVRHREDVLQVVSQIAGVRKFRDVLLRQGYVVKYREFDGGHEFDDWSKTLPEALIWALPNPASEEGQDRT
jgi:enterochelin esterase-like enzyme